jgi:hypothetical protein
VALVTGLTALTPESVNTSPAATETDVMNCNAIDIVLALSVDAYDVVNSEFTVPVSAEPRVSVVMFCDMNVETPPISPISPVLYARIGDLLHVESSLATSHRPVVGRGQNGLADRPAGRPEQVEPFRPLGEAGERADVGAGRADPVVDAGIKTRQVTVDLVGELDHRRRITRSDRSLMFCVRSCDVNWKSTPIWLLTTIGN